MRTARAFASLFVPLAGVAAGGFAAASTQLSAPAVCAATYTSHVTLVVEHADGRVIGLCIGFDGSGITGEQILHASGLEYATSSYGAGLGDAVCQIDNEPASYPPGCFSSNSPYWAFFVARGGGGWQAADHGVSSEQFADGDAAGFRYDSQSGSLQQPASPSGICAAVLRGSASAQPSPVTTPARSGHAGTAASTPAAVTATASGPTVPAQPVTPGASVITPPAAAGRPAATTAPSAPQTGPQAPLLAACAAGGALAGLLGVRIARQRRRRA